MNYLVIGDIAGRYKELVQLINLAPEDAQIISCGDLVDRGEDTKSVLDLFMKEKYQAVRGNHEDMMIDCYRKGCKYEEGLWLLNGGVETVKSFLSIKDKIRFDQIYYAEKIDFNSLDRFIQMIPKKYIKYLEGLPYFISFDDFIVSHAPLIIKGNTFEKDFDFKFMWNRFPPMELNIKYLGIMVILL